LGYATAEHYQTQGEINERPDFEKWNSPGVSKYTDNTSISAGYYALSI
jgi:hypothetical protein